MFQCMFSYLTLNISSETQCQLLIMLFSDFSSSSQFSLSLNCRQCLQCIPISIMLFSQLASVQLFVPWSLPVYLYLYFSSSFSPLCFDHVLCSYYPLVYIVFSFPDISFCIWLFLVFSSQCDSLSCLLDSCFVLFSYFKGSLFYYSLFLCPSKRSSFLMGVNLIKVTIFHIQSITHFQIVTCFALNFYRALFNQEVKLKIKSLFCESILVPDRLH